LIIKFQNISKEEFEKFLNLLRSSGFKNKNPMNGQFANEVIFYKPEWGSAASLKRNVP